MAENPPTGLDIASLRVAMERLGAGTFEEAWLARFANELNMLVAMGRKLDELDLSGEEPCHIYAIPGGRS